MPATWSTPSDFATSHIVTSPEWNALNGASGNLAFVYSAMNTITQTSTAKTQNTAYQNTTGKIRMVNIAFSATTNFAELFYSGSTNPPTTRVGYIQDNISAASYYTISLIVPPSYYYTASSGGGGPITVQNWVEWDFHNT